MKKIFLSIFLLFSILTYSAGHIEELSQPRAIRSNKEKVVSITGFPSDFENTLEGMLENELGWKTSNRNNSFSIEGFNIHFNESESYKGYEGIIRFTDLRTGKRIGYYEFEAEKFDDIISNVLEYMDYISEAQ
ncbi:hypothetical protein ACWYBU_05470 [Fusobacterium polymorphum]